MEIYKCVKFQWCLKNNLLGTRLILYVTCHMWDQEAACVGARAEHQGGRTTYIGKHVFYWY